jgi:hypothetical protein
MSCISSSNCNTKQLSSTCTNNSRQWPNFHPSSTNRYLLIYRFDYWAKKITNYLFIYILSFV